MLAYTYVKPHQFALMDKPWPTLRDDRDVIARVALAGACTGDLRIRHGFADSCD